MSLQINKRLKRAVDYSFKDEGRVLCFEFDKPSDEVYRKVGEKTLEEAHKWFQGHDQPPRVKIGSRQHALAVGLVDILGPGPEDDPERYQQAGIAMTAWSSAQSALFGVIRELQMMRDNPDDYATKRFEGW